MGRKGKKKSARKNVKTEHSPSTGSQPPDGHTPDSTVTALDCARARVLPRGSRRTRSQPPRGNPPNSTGTDLDCARTRSAQIGERRTRSCSISKKQPRSTGAIQKSGIPRHDYKIEPRMMSYLATSLPPMNQESSEPCSISPKEPRNTGAIPKSKILGRRDEKIELQFKSGLPISGPPRNQDSSESCSIRTKQLRNTGAIPKSGITRRDYEIEPPVMSSFATSVSPVQRDSSESRSKGKKLLWNARSLPKYRTPRRGYKIKPQILSDAPTNAPSVHQDSSDAHSKGKQLPWNTGATSRSGKPRVLGTRPTDVPSVHQDSPEYDRLVRRLWNKLVLSEDARYLPACTSGLIKSPAPAGTPLSDMAVFPSIRNIYNADGKVVDFFPKVLESCYWHKSRKIEPPRGHASNTQSPPGAENIWGTSKQSEMCKVNSHDMKEISYSLYYPLALGRERQPTGLEVPTTENSSSATSCELPPISVRGAAAQTSSSSTSSDAYLECTNMCKQKKGLHSEKNAKKKNVKTSCSSDFNEPQDAKNQVAGAAFRLGRGRGNAPKKSDNCKPKKEKKRKPKKKVIQSVFEETPEEIPEEATPEYIDTFEELDFVYSEMSGCSYFGSHLIGISEDAINAISPIEIQTPTAEDTGPLYAVLDVINKGEEYYTSQISARVVADKPPEPECDPDVWEMDILGVKLHF